MDSLKSDACNPFIINVKKQKYIQKIYLDFRLILNGALSKSRQKHSLSAIKE